jgi:5-methylcytosine-specific restriction endonuclease McrA
MKVCPKCNIFKIKNNSYDVCYTCHSNKDESSSETEQTPKEQPRSGSGSLRDEPQVFKRESIPKCVRNALWINYFKDSRTGMCQCCLREQITIGNFHAGHIIAHANGGLTTLDNLTPLCMLCNTSMSTYDLNEFIKKYNLHHGL